MVNKDYTGNVTGGASTEELAPAIITLEEACAYCDESRSRYKEEEAKTRLVTDEHKAASGYRKTLMLFGRAVAGPDVLYRVGVLDRPAFRRLHSQVSDHIPNDAQIAGLELIQSQDEAKAFLEKMLQKLEATRSSTDEQRIVRPKAQHFQRWLTNFGHVLEAASILVRQRLIPANMYEQYHQRAMVTLLPSTTEVEGLRLR